MITDDPSVWLAKDYGSPRSWVLPLSSECQDEIEASVCNAVTAGKTYTDVSQADFPLPKTRAMLHEVFAELEDGRGFSVVGNFPCERFTYEESLIGYAGLSSHLGKLVDQSYAGDMKVDVKDMGLTYGKDVRGYQSNAMLRFHTDGAVLTGLLCLEGAVEGGLSVLISAGALSNIILRDRPDLHEVLVKGFYHHRRGEHAAGDNPVSPAPIPVFAFYDGLLHCTYDRNQSLWAAEAGVTISPKQIEAMDYLDGLMTSDALQLHMEMRKGDIQFLNNFTVMHSRTEYRDGPHQKRHLIRYWIDVPDGKRKGLTTRDLYVRKEKLAEQL
ncbi:MAG: TauD/TfdA family dioxygenase [Burkholderiaceae bacterium]